jgi:hypothetical protein
MKEVFIRNHFSDIEIKRHLRQNYKWHNQSLERYNKNINKEKYSNNIKSLNEWIEEIVKYAKINNIDLNIWE